MTSNSARLQSEKLDPLNQKHLQRQFFGDQKQNVINKTKEIVQKHYEGRLVEF